MQDFGSMQHPGDRKLQILACLRADKLTQGRAVMQPLGSSQTRQQS